MSQIAQVQITFVAGEDRLLMRLATDADEEFRFWLTRRFVKALRPHLGQSLTRQPRIQTQANPQARRELLRFEHEQAVQNSDFRTPYQASAKSLPLGETPLLLTRFQLRPGENGTVTLALGKNDGPGIDLALNSTLMHSIMALMDTAIASAEWDLEVSVAAPHEPDGGGDKPALN